ncbi:MAG: hypothetical protein P8103_20370 [Candidatus Thiodiazotropha sp.]
MKPIIIPLASFRFFDAAVTRSYCPFSDIRIFSEFSSLVETFLLSDSIYFFSVGAYASEWGSGQIIPTAKATYNPFEAFHGIDFIKEAPFDYMGQEKKIIQMISQDEREVIFDEYFGKEPRNKFGLWTYLSAYVQAYNGSFGPVEVKEYPLIKELLPKVIFYCDSGAPVVSDPLINKAYDLLKETYASKLEAVTEFNLMQIIIPPLTAIVLDRLPDHCSDPYIVVRTILDLREELDSVRAKFADLENTLYSQGTELKDLLGVKGAIEADAKALGTKFNMPFQNSAMIRWFIDKASFIGKLIILQKTEQDEVVDTVASLIPMFGERLNRATPSLLFDMTLKTKNIKGYSSLVERKLGLDIT